VDARGTVFIVGGEKVAGGHPVQRRVGDAWVVEANGAGVRIGAGPADRVVVAQEGERGGALLGMLPAASAPPAATLPVGAIPISTNMGVMAVPQPGTKATPATPSQPTQPWTPPAVSFSASGPTFGRTVALTSLPIVSMNVLTSDIT